MLILQGVKDPMDLVRVLVISNPTEDFKTMRAPDVRFRVAFYLWGITTTKVLERKERKGEERKGMGRKGLCCYGVLRLESLTTRR